MIQFLKSNLKHALKNQRALVVLTLMIQLFSVIVIVFSYGVINHYQFKVNEKESTTLIYDFKSKTDEEGYAKWVSMDKVDDFIEKVLPLIEKKLDYFYIMGNVDNYSFQCSSGYESGRFTVSTQLADRIGVISGEIFTNEQMNSSEDIVIAPEVMVDDEGYATIGEVKYKAVGILSSSAYAPNWVFAPYKTMPENTRVFYISLLFEQPLWESEYNEIVQLITGVFGDNFNIPEFDGIVNESSNRVYRDIIFIIGFLIVVCAVNYCIMYRYMLEKRRREFAITRICGCSRYKAGIVYMAELLGTSLITLILGQLMYHYCILPEAKKHFYYIGLFYDIAVYKTISIIYVGVLCVTYFILVSKFVKRTPVSLIREV